MPRAFDRVLETSATTGTGNLTVTGAASGYRTWASAGVVVDEPVYYAAHSGADWEVGIGRFSSATVLVRTTVLASSNANALVNFTASINVFSTLPAVSRRNGQYLLSRSGAI